MPERVLIISVNRCVTPDPVFPLGLAYLNAALRSAGYETLWHDCLSQMESIRDAAARFRPQYAAISLRNIDDVIITRKEVFFDTLHGICSDLHEICSCKIILGGSGFSLFPCELLKLSGADFGIVGEGEHSILKLLQSGADQPVINGEDLRGIPGLVYRESERVVVNQPQMEPLGTQLVQEDRPQPVFDYYSKTGGMMNVQTQRGCRHQCCYCTYPVIEGRYSRRRCPDEVAEEFALLKAKGAKYVFIVDSIFNSSPTHVHETCEALIRKNVGLPWGCFLRPQGLTAELVQTMAQAGLTHVEFGSDSFSDTVLAAYGKQLTFDDILQSHALVRAAKLDCCHFLIAGGPGESVSTLEETYANSARLPEAVVMAVIGMRIYPGTMLFKRAQSEGRIGENQDLLTPCYYLADGLTAEQILERLRCFAGKHPGWIVGDPAPGYQQMVLRLRARGVVGPLWSYLAMLQRIRPAMGK